MNEFSPNVFVLLPLHLVKAQFTFIAVEHLSSPLFLYTDGRFINDSGGGGGGNKCNIASTPSMCVKFKHTPQKYEYGVALFL